MNSKTSRLLCGKYPKFHHEDTGYAIKSDIEVGHKQVILIIENAVDVTGSLNSVLRSCTYLRDRYQFLFILPQGSRALKLVSEQNFDVYEFQMTEVRKNIKSLLKYLPTLLRNAIKLRRFILKHKVNLILNNDFYNLLPAAYRLTGGKVRYICYVRFLPSKFPSVLVNIWFRTHLRCADSIVAVSNAVKRELPRADRVIVISNELPLISLPLSVSNSKVMLYPSNFIRGKGQEHAVRMLTLLTKQFKEWKIRFIGSDMGFEKNAKFKKSLIQLAADLGVADQTEWLDFDGRIVDHYNEAAIVLNFSESESFSMTCLEAMFYGRPVVATRCGGPEEIVGDHLNGFLVDRGDFTQMAKAVQTLIGSDEIRASMGQAAYRDVRLKFSAENTVERLAKLYQSILLK